MRRVTIPDTGGVTSELVWDADCHGAQRIAPDGCLTVGSTGAGIPPESLLAAAADAALMVEFLERSAAAGMQVFGYVSATRFDAPEGTEATPPLVLLPAVLVHADDLARAERLLREAFAGASVLRRLGQDVRLEGSIQPVTPAGPG